jgi:toxin secretion/phage lysis holin
LRGSLFFIVTKGEKSVENLWKYFVGILGGLASGGWTLAVQILFTFVALDYITGLIASATEGKLSSKTGAKGIYKKVMTFAFVAVGHLVDVYLGGGNDMFRDGVIAFFIANEVTSIVENAGRMGMPIPPVIKQAIEVLKPNDKTKEKERKDV